MSLKNPFNLFSRQSQRKKEQQALEQEYENLLNEIESMRLSIKMSPQGKRQKERLSMFKGQGIEFFEVRPYSFNDDAKNIDWNVTARLDNVHVKLFCEDRDTSLVIATDVSDSFWYGSGPDSKKAAALKIACNLSMDAISNNEHVQYAMFEDGITGHISNGKKHDGLYRFLNQAFFYRGGAKKTGLKKSFEELNLLLSRKSAVVIISDFISDTNWKEPFSLLAKRHQLPVHPVIRPI